MKMKLINDEKLKIEHEIKEICSEVLFDLPSLFKHAKTPEGRVFYT
jgi:hypothetical protein